jgi:[ribosomal protein S18]-alanine N-acetyltransferase
MQIQPFTATHAALVASWARSADEAVKWAAVQTFPVSAQTVVDWQDADDVRAHLLWADGVPVGYGELWLDTEEDEVELARIIVAPELRGTGLGQVLVRALVSRAVTAGYQDVFMRVHPDNAAALGSYRAAGFVTVAPDLAAAWNEPQPFDYVWLQYGASNRNCFRQ